MYDYLITEISLGYIYFITEQDKKKLNRKKKKKNWLGLGILPMPQKPIMHWKTKKKEEEEKWF